MTTRSPPGVGQARVIKALPNTAELVMRQSPQASTGAFENLFSPKEKYVDMNRNMVEVEFASMKATLNTSC